MARLATTDGLTEQQQEILDVTNLAPAPTLESRQVSSVGSA